MFSFFRFLVFLTLLSIGWTAHKRKKFVGVRLKTMRKCKPSDNLLKFNATTGFAGGFYSNTSNEENTINKGSITIVGGYYHNKSILTKNDEPMDIPSNLVNRYTAWRHNWTNLTGLTNGSRANEAPNSVTFNGTIYFAYGLNDSNNTHHFTGISAYNMINDTYDPEFAPFEGIYKFLSNPSMCLDFSSKENPKLVVVGGCLTTPTKKNSNDDDNVLVQEQCSINNRWYLIYDIRQRKWFPQNQSASYASRDPHYLGTCLCYDKYLYVFGGVTSGQVSANRVEFINMLNASDIWHQDDTKSIELGIGIWNQQIVYIPPSDDDTNHEQRYYLIGGKNETLISRRVYEFTGYIGSKKKQCDRQFSNYFRRLECLTQFKLIAKRMAKRRSDGVAVYDQFMKRIYYFGGITGKEENIRVSESILYSSLLEKYEWYPMKLWVSIIVFIFCVFCGFYVIFDFFKHKEKRKIPGKLMLSRTFIDLTFAFLCIGMVRIMDGNHATKYRCSILGSIFTLMFLISQSYFAGICWDLYITLTNPFRKPASDGYVIHLWSWLIVSIIIIISAVKGAFKYRLDVKVCYIKDTGEDINYFNVYLLYLPTLFVLITGVGITFWAFNRLKDKILDETWELRWEVIRKQFVIVFCYTASYVIGGCLWFPVIISNFSNKTEHNKGICAPKPQKLGVWQQYFLVTIVAVQLIFDVLAWYLIDKDTFVYSLLAHITSNNDLILHSKPKSYKKKYKNNNEKRRHLIDENGNPNTNESEISLNNMSDFNTNKIYQNRNTLSQPKRKKVQNLSNALRKEVILLMSEGLALACKKTAQETYNVSEVEQPWDINIGNLNSNDRMRTYDDFDDTSSEEDNVDENVNPLDRLEQQSYTQSKTINIDLNQSLVSEMSNLSRVSANSKRKSKSRKRKSKSKNRSSSKITIKQPQLRSSQSNVSTVASKINKELTKLDKILSCKEPEPSVSKYAQSLDLSPDQNRGTVNRYMISSRKILLKSAGVIPPPTRQVTSESREDENDSNNDDEIPNESTILTGNNSSATTNTNVNNNTLSIPLVSSNNDSIVAKWQRFRTSRIVSNINKDSNALERPFTDYSPHVFRYLRTKIYGISDVEYYKSVLGNLELSSSLQSSRDIIAKFSEGRSGAFFFYTKDSKYIIKTLNKSESELLLQILRKYARYMENNPNSYLNKYLGLHSIKLYSSEIFFCVIDNVFVPTKDPQEKYDIKGSWVDRHTNYHVDLGKLMKDEDLIKTLLLDPIQSSEMFLQLDKDSKFLASVDIMDYSLLLGIYYVGINPDTVLKTPGGIHLPPPEDLGAIGTWDDLQKENDRRISKQSVQNKRNSGLSKSKLLEHNRKMKKKEELDNEDSCSSEEYMDQIISSIGSKKSSHLQIDNDKNDSKNISKKRHSSKEYSKLSQSGLKLKNKQEITFSKSSIIFPESLHTNRTMLEDLEGGNKIRSRAPTYFSGIESVGKTEKAIRAKVIEGPGIYYIGIIDMLQKWDLNKKLERIFKVYLRFKDKNGISCVEPEFYRKRFMRKMVRIGIKPFDPEKYAYYDENGRQINTLFTNDIINTSIKEENDEITIKM